MEPRSVFVPSDDWGSREETATVLVGTAEEFDISKRDILVRPQGFYITEALAALVYDEDSQTDQTPDEIPVSKGKTSQHRAAKKQKTKE